MQDYKKFAVLYVDDEEKSLKYFARAFDEHFRILTAASAEAGFQLLQEHKDDIGILMTDQRMPGEKGAQFLERARQLRPRIIRILATAYSDLDAVIAAVNTGAVYKYVTKPWDPPQLEMTLRRGLELFMLQRERDQLLKEKMAALQHVMVTERVVSLGLLASGMSHHIRNSLVAIKTFLDLTPSMLQGEKVDMASLRNPDFWGEYYQNVLGQVEKINTLLKELWLASEKAPVQFGDEIQIPSFLAEIAAKMKPALEAKGIRLILESPGALPSMMVDKPKFTRLFELILQDELVSLPAGAAVTITARVSAESTPEREEVEIEIRDDGPGLPPESLRVLFDPFVVRSDSPKEYGISLMACYFIVHHHGGRIEARAAEPHGTLFRLRIPAHPERLAVTEQNSEFFRKIQSNENSWERLIASEQ